MVGPWPFAKEDRRQAEHREMIVKPGGAEAGRRVREVCVREASGDEAEQFFTRARGDVPAKDAVLREVRGFPPGVEEALRIGNSESLVLLAQELICDQARDAAADMPLVQPGLLCARSDRPLPPGVLKENAGEPRAPSLENRRWASGSRQFQGSSEAPAHAPLDPTGRGAREASPRASEPLPRPLPRAVPAVRPSPRPSTRGPWLAGVRSKWKSSFRSWHLERSLGAPVPSCGSF